MAMVAQAATRQPTRWSVGNQATARLIETMLAFATLLSLLMVSWLLIRRLAGQLQRPLSGWALLAVALVALVAVSGLRFTWKQSGFQRFTLRSWTAWLWTLPSLTLLLLGCVLTLPGTSTGALFLFWGLLIAGDLSWWFYLSRRWPAVWRMAQPGATPVPANTSTAVAADRPHLPASETAHISRPVEDLVEELEGEDEEVLPTGVTQQLTRCHDQEGRESVEGLLRQPFLPGERSRSMHVAFCPPLHHRPAVEVVQVEGPAARIKAAEVHPYGVRFDLRLMTTCERPEEILIHFAARESTTP